MTKNHNPPPIIASLVAEDDRLDFFSTFFGPLALRGETLIYDCMEHLCQSYYGGMWNYYTLSNGGFYLAPAYNNVIHVVANNGFKGGLSADAVGIVATLTALSQLGLCAVDDTLINHYFSLRNFALEHDESMALACISNL